MRVARPVVGLATILALLPASVLAASPSPAAPAPSGSPVAGPSGPALTGTDWMLVSYTAEDGGRAGPSAPSSIRFDDGVVSGNTGCNGFSGPYTSDGDALTIGDLAVTQMYCEPTSAQEPAILAGLGDVVAYRTDTGDLELLDKQGNSQLTYRTLEGQTWVPMFSGDMPVPASRRDARVPRRHGVRPGSLQRVLRARRRSTARASTSARSPPTKIACPDLEIEQAMFAALTAADRGPSTRATWSCRTSPAPSCSASLPPRPATEARRSWSTRSAGGLPPALRSPGPRRRLDRLRRHLLALEGCRSRAVPDRSRHVLLDHGLGALDTQLLREIGDVGGLTGEDGVLRRQLPQRRACGRPAPSCGSCTRTGCPSRPADRSSAAFSMAPRLDVRPQVRRELGVVVQRVLEPGREVDLGGLDLGEVVEQLVGQRRGTVLDRARQAVAIGTPRTGARASRSRA